jgi:ketosteroid isomerase-like protein
MCQFRHGSGIKVMKIVSLLFAGLLVFAAHAHADDEADVRAFVAAYDRAYHAGSTQAIETLPADGYRVVVDGELEHRAAALAEFAATDRPVITSMSSTIDRVYIAGDLAAAVGRIERAQDAKKGSEHYTLVLRREAGRWQAVDEHVSDVVDKAAR